MQGRPRLDTSPGAAALVSGGDQFIVRGTGTYRGVPLWSWMGILSAGLLYIAATTFSAVTLPWKGTADSFAHMDYVYQVHHGEIPAPYGYKYSQETPDKSRQWASAHPPLFYAIASVPMGAPLDSGAWHVAVAYGRALNILIGLGAVFALAWAGWLLGGKNRAALAVALPAVGGLFPTFVRFCGDIYNDPLAVLLSVLAMAMSCNVVINGVTRPRLALLMVICALGMASRATFVFALVIALCALMTASIKHSARPLVTRGIQGAGMSMALAGAAILPIAWFYQRNHELSGSWFRSVAKHAMQGRDQLSLLDVITNDRFWLLIPEGLLGPKWRSLWPVNDDISLSLFVLSSLCLVYISITGGHWKKIRGLDALALAWVLVAAHFGGLLVAQLQHAVGWGSLNVRYFLPALLSIGLLLAAPAVTWGRFSAYVVGAISGLMAFGTVAGTMTYLDSRYRSLARGEDSVARLFAALRDNGLSDNWIWVLLSLMTCAVLLVAYSISRLHRDSAPAADALHPIGRSST